MLKLFNFIAFLYFSLLHLSLKADDIVLYGSFDNSYSFELLEHTLNYFPENQYELSNYRKFLPKKRAFENMKFHKEIDVVFGGANREREELALPIRIPILKGLNGWRIPLINKEETDLFDKVLSMKNFKQLIPGQIYSWSDTKVLESNGIKVAKASSYEGLFLMLDKQRIDYFPRSILEIHDEYEQNKHLNIAIEESTLIHYPTAYYYYVSPNNPALAENIRIGLERAISDGSFDKIFEKHYGKVIKNIRKMNRRVFSLNNPFLSKKTPISRSELWVDFNHNSERNK